jgi:DNA polymerase-3 subunit epsilon
MFNFFKPKPKNQIEMEVSGINPETNNEFLFYNFIENTPNYILEPWLKKAKQVGYKVKPQYEQAILQKLKFNQFKNPHTFPEYFENKFDFIAIDFETANIPPKGSIIFAVRKSNASNKFIPAIV